MLIYLDMDGVLTDLDGPFAEKLGVTRQHLLDDRDLRARAHAESKLAHGVDHWRNIPPNRPEVWRAAIRRWVSKGHSVEILTSYGRHDPQDMGLSPHHGKRDWLHKHFGKEVSEGLISRYNGVASCHQKAFYAREGCLLVDDQPENVESFIKAGGRAFLYQIWSHDATFNCIEEAVTSA